MAEEPLLEVEDLVKHFPVGRGILKKSSHWIKAVDGVCLDIREGESFGLVGESGCGKSTLGRLVLRLIEPTRGAVRFRGFNLLSLSREEMRRMRKHLQIIFQDPYASLDPRMKVEKIVTEPLRVFSHLTRSQRRRSATELLERVGLKVDDMNKYPHEFSGGQRQRIGIARALATRPQLIVADEPVSALDVSIQAQVINLLQDLQTDFNLSYLFISHDLSVVEHVCDRIAVMYLGRIVELASGERFISDCRHPYTRALLDSVPMPDPHRRRKQAFPEGDLPDPMDPPSGCAYHPRCPQAIASCSLQKPSLLPAGPDHKVACWLNNGRGII